MGGSTKVAAPAAQPTVTEQYTEWLKAYPSLQPLLASAAKSDLASRADIYQTSAPATLAAAMKGAAGVQSDYGKAVEGETASSMRDLLGKLILGELKSGSSLSDAQAKELEQSVRAAQVARGITGGNAAIYEEAATKGTAGQQLASSRKAAAQSFLSFNSATNPSALKALSGITDGSTVGNSQIMTGAVAQQGSQDAQYQQLVYNANAANAASKAAANQGLGSILGTLAGAGIGYGVGGGMGGMIGAGAGGALGKGVGGMF